MFGKGGSLMDYLELWNRWVELTTLSEKDRATMMDNLSENVTKASQALAMLSAAEMKQQLEKHGYKEWNTYLETATPILMLGTLDGYLLSLMVQGNNPLNINEKSIKTSDNLSDRWQEVYQKDQGRSYTEQIDPIISLFLQKIQELRVNQILALHPDIIKLPYETTERLTQYIGWSIRQGYVLGLLQEKI